MARAILVHEFGGPEQLTPGDIDVPEAASGQVSIRQTAIGVNYIDTYLRKGLYPIDLPGVVGDQATGIVESIGPGVTDLQTGDRVAYASALGSYTEARVVEAEKLVRVPDDLSDDLVAATLTRGLTAEYLLFRLHALQAGEAILVHAAAGGAGLLICQWAKHIGATVIGTVGSEDKGSIARGAGADQVLLHGTDFAVQVRELTDGRGVDVVYDSIGRATFQKSLECLRPRGLMVAFGNASGAPEPFDVLTLSRLGSLFLTRPRLDHYVASKTELDQSAARYFRALSGGIVTPHPVTRFALDDAADAHRHLEDRAETTIPILVP